MKKTIKPTSGSKKVQLLASALLAGAVITVPVLSFSAAAGVSLGDQFMVKAQNSDDATIQAYAGLTGIYTPGGPTDGDGTGNEGGNNGTDGEDETNQGATVFSMSCGPMTLDITEQTLAYSKIAEDLIKAGREDEVVANPEGWKVLTSTEDMEDIHLGLAFENPMAVVLGDASSFMNPNAVRAQAMVMGEDCYMMDDRKSPKEGLMISSSKSPDKNTLAIGRYEKIGDSLVYTAVTEDDEGYSVSRQAGVANPEKLKNSRVPHNLVVSKNSPNKTEVSVLFSEAINGATGVKIKTEADSSGSATYTSDAIQTVTADRQSVPSVIHWDMNGNVDSLTYKGESYSSVEEFNSATGLNWDGRYHTLEDFDLSLPFIPSELYKK